MNKKIMTGAGVALLAATGVTLALAKDPVIMTVNGVDVPLSEFEYLYHKNSQQQMDPQPLDEYVEMFGIYKMKVADALAAGIDTTAGFQREYEQYRRELAQPYMTDSTVIYKYVQEACDLMKQEAEVKHIMRMKGHSPQEGIAARATLDSLQKELRNGADFQALAMQYSQDPSVKMNQGNYGYLTFTKIPFYTFMKTAFTLPEGEVSEVVETPTAYHLLVGGKKRPAQGEYRAAHIMKMTRGLSEADAAKAKVTIDSLYSVLQAEPNKFGELAMKYSDDKGTAQNAGILPWFSTGDMVKEFYDATVALEDRAISAPVLSPYGWHIVQRLEHRAPASCDQLAPGLIRTMGNPNDERALLILQDQNQRLAKQLKASTTPALAQLLAKAQEAGLSDNLIETADGSAAVAMIGKQPVQMQEFIDFIGNVRVPDPLAGAQTLSKMWDRFYNGKLQEAEMVVLEKTEPDYRNLLNEFRDGSLLYEVSLQKVWDKASKDTEGLAKYFADNKESYNWTKPHVKGYLVQAQNDSVAELVRKRMAELAPDTLLRTVRREFRNKAQVDRVLMEQGQNPMVDNVVFNGPKVQPQNANYSVYFMYEPVVMMKPEEVEDVRGLVTSDYQNQLEKEWVEELKMKYPMTVYPKVVKKVK